jgi:hypothetical protein
MSHERPAIIAIDFDETIVTNGFPTIGNAQLKPYVVEVMNKLYDKGYYIIIWTCRYTNQHIQDMVTFLDKHGIPYDSINKNYTTMEFKPYPKIYADVYIDDRSLFSIDWKWIYEFIQVKLITENVGIEKEMAEYFFTRTKQHIELFNKYYSYLGYSINYMDKHDSSKFENLELLPYIYITWSYYCKQNKIVFSTSDLLDAMMYEATVHHIKTNSHHPEFWTTQTKNIINKDNRDSNQNVSLIDATSMPFKSLDQLCCDWKAVSVEKNNNVLDFAKQNINKRWKFTEEQEKYIYTVLNKLEQFTT